MISCSLLRMRRNCRSFCARRAAFRRSAAERRAGRCRGGARLRVQVSDQRPRQRGQLRDELRVHGRHGRLRRGRGAPQRRGAQDLGRRVDCTHLGVAAHGLALAVKQNGGVHALRRAKRHSARSRGRRKGHNAARMLRSANERACHARRALCALMRCSVASASPCAVHAARVSLGGSGGSGGRRAMVPRGAARAPRTPPAEPPAAGAQQAQARARAGRGAAADWAR